MRILYMGTPDFAVPILKALHESRHEVIGAVTQPDKPKGRGYQLTPPPVKVYANSVGIPVFQPATLRAGAFDETLKTLSPDIIAVAAYGKILPPDVLHFPKYGCVNVHGSLLPKYRGAAPMQRAILEGCAETGVTTMQMAEGMDTGDMLEWASIPILDSDDFETIHDKLSLLGASLLLSTLEKIENGTVCPVVQDDAQATYAAKIEKADCLLDFGRPVREIFNKIRALSPFPLSFTHLPDGRMLKVVKAMVGLTGTPDKTPGTVLTLSDSVEVACADGTILLQTVLPEGRGRMSARDFINGRNVSVGDILN